MGQHLHHLPKALGQTKRNTKKRAQIQIKGKVIPNIIAKNIKKFDAFIALGCVIKGQTDHYFFISQSVTTALINLSVKSKKPIGFGILTVNNYKQAKERALISKKNKGKEVALGVISILKN